MKVKLGNWTFVLLDHQQIDGEHHYNCIGGSSFVVKEELHQEIQKALIDDLKELDLDERLVLYSKKFKSEFDLNCLIGLTEETALEVATRRGYNVVTWPEVAAAENYEKNCIQIILDGNKKVCIVNKLDAE